MDLQFQNLAIELTTYGKKKFSNSDFLPVTNNATRSKPKGGLWASPKNSEYGWKDWCEDNDFYTDKLKNKFDFTYKGNTAVIEKEEDLYSNLIWQSLDRRKGVVHLEAIDYEAMIEAGCDAIFLTEEGQYNTRLTFPRNLYGWDCECVLILNPKTIYLHVTKHSKTFIKHNTN